ncbi:jasmonate O-methyltransferase-like [Tripterygium wilfordii]|uniref:Jasmonate O-methyltransferase-like n=1 Tax=Tripterygium wilfordii TaxID=458696 RepID=A0A7J7D360_TRIWF|nr:jasmonate O-methyltransferase [Tripterygium wilfordii]KAF5740785.1 jasmonate O-methyltransferase-like [Tripterygium wilfordii]
MEVMQVLHMNKGNGETSYAQNSKVQGKILSIAKPVMEEALVEMLSTNYIPESMGIADLGCSSGPNTLLVISEILDIVCAKCRNLGRPAPEFRVSLNDLPTNDFNSIFASLPAFYNKLNLDKGSGFGPCFVSGIAGSFYGRLFPSKSLHFLHSSSSLHWLSQVPAGLMTSEGAKNKGKMYISKSSPQCVLDEYSSQFQKDFSLFLRSRAEETVQGGRMALSFMGRRTIDPTTEESCHHWELLSRALMSMVSEGLVEEEKLDSFNTPYYAPCPEELELEIQREGSFFVDRLEAFEVDWDGGVVDNDIGGGGDETTFCTITMGDRVAKTIRAVVESMLEAHFGGEIMDDLFRRFAVLVDDHFSKASTKYINLAISLIKKPNDMITHCNI